MNTDISGSAPREQTAPLRASAGNAAPAPVPASIYIGRMNFLRVRELAKKIHAMTPRLFNSTRDGSRWKIKLIGRDLGPAAT